MSSASTQSTSGSIGNTNGGGANATGGSSGSSSGGFGLGLRRGLGLTEFFASSSLMNAAPVATTPSSSSQSHTSSIGRASLLAAFVPVESPLSQLKRAGLGFISRGLGSLGLGGLNFTAPSVLGLGGLNFTAPSVLGLGLGVNKTTTNDISSSNPRNELEGEHGRQYESVLIVCVVGGLSFRELSQIQAVLSYYSSTGECSVLPNVVVVSTHMIAPEDCLRLAIHATNN